jgi:hypothetical protein
MDYDRVELWVDCEAALSVDSMVVKRERRVLLSDELKDGRRVD